MGHHNLNIIQINKGNSIFYNRITQIKLVIQNHKADIVVINEANISVDDQISQFRFDGFTMEKDNLGLTTV